MQTTLRAIALNSLFFVCFSILPTATAVSATPNSINEEQWVMLVYQKGKENYDRGDYVAASAEWDKLSEVVDRYPAFKTVVDYLRGRTKNISPELADQVEQQLAARKKQIETAFQKGKDLYNQGKMTEALAEWDNLSTYLPEDASQRRLIEDLRKYYLESQQTAVSGGLTKETSVEMQKFFAAAGELFRTQAEQAKTALAASDTAQKNIDEAYSKAKLLYYQGSYPEAMKEIEKLVPYFSQGSADRKGAESLARVYQQSLDEKGSAEKALKQKSVKVKLPPDFQKFTAEVDEKFRAELKESETRRSASEKSLEDKQAWSSEDFQKGSDLYRQGKIDEAVRQWESVASQFENERSMRALVETVKKNQAERARIQKELEGALAEKQALINGRLEKGRLLYEAGNFEEAKREWTSVKSLLDSDSKLDEFIAQMQQAYQDSLKVRKSEEEAKNVVNTRVKMPESLDTTLASARQKLASETEASETRRKQAEQKATVEKEILVKNSLEKGLLLFEQDDFGKAEAEWSAIESSVTDAQKLRDFIGEMKKIHQQRLEVNKTVRETEAAAAVRLPLSEAFQIALKNTQEKLKSQTQIAITQRQNAEATLQERQALLSKTIASGKALLDTGKFQDAFKEWKSLLPIVDDAEGLKKALDALDSDFEAAQKAEGDAKLAETKKDLKVGLSDDLSTLLLDAGRQIRAQNEAASSRKKQAERSLIDRQAFVSEHFEKGKVYYDGNKFSDALKEWSTILPNLEDEAKLKPLIEQAMTDQQSLAVSQKSALDAELHKDQKLKTPGDLSKMMEAARAKILAETAAAKALTAAADKNYASRQLLVQNTFEKGKTLHEEGRYSEALKEWSAILDDIEDSETLRSSIKAIEARYEESIISSKAAEEAEARKNSKLPAPVALKPLLAEVQQKIATQTQSYAARNEKASQIVAGRLTEIDGVFAKGKLAAENGDLEEALNQWGALLPSVVEEAELRAKISQVQADKTSLAEVLKAAEESEKRQTSKVEVPAALEATLMEISVKLQGEAGVARNRKEQMEKTADARKTLVRNTFEKGKQFYDENRYHEALKEWEGILPQIDHEDALKPLFDKAMKGYESLAISQKEASDAESLKDQKLKTPAELPTFLQGMSDQLHIHTLETRNQRAQAEHSLELRQSDVDKTVMRGNALFRESKIDEAKAEWLSLLSSVEDEVLLKNTVEALVKVHEDRVALEKTEKETTGLPQQRFKLPSELSTELSDASQKLEAQRTEAEAKRRIALESLGKREAEMREVFDKGKKFYWEGRLAEAIQSWASIAPILEDLEVKTQIAVVAQSYENLLSAQQETQTAELRKDNKLKTPEELPKLLGDMNQIVLSQAQYSDTQKKIADQTYVDRQALINTTFQKGKNLYEQNRIPEALDEWASISPYLEKGSELRAFIDSVAKGYQNSQIAKRAADEAQLKRTIKFQTPADLSKYLSEASAKMKAQVEDSHIQKEAADRSRAERQVWVDGKFEHGKLLYQKGDVTGAVDEWKTILPYIEDDSKVRQLILKAEENKKALESQNMEKAMALPTPTKIVIPPDLGKALAAANADLEKSMEKNSRAKLENDVQNVIQEKKKKNSKKEDSKKVQAATRIPLDDIEQMMLEYNITTPQELEKRHQEMKAIK